MEKLYLDKDNSEKASEIVDAIEKATSGTFVGYKAMSTLLGIQPVYDKQGRNVSIDLNTKESYIMIDNVEYKLITKGFKCNIVKPKYNDKVRMHLNVPKECLIAQVDFEPNYVKEYWENFNKN